MAEDFMIPQLRNVKKLPDGDYDIELYNPVHGWIPFTARKNDPEEYGREIWAFIKEMRGD